MSDNESTQAEQGPTDGPSQKPSVSPMADFRLTLEKIDELAKDAEYFAQRGGVITDPNFAPLLNLVARGIRLGQEILVCVIKEKACSAGGTTPTSTPSV